MNSHSLVLAGAILLQFPSAAFAAETLTATVSFDGKVPAAKRIHTEADEYCKAHPMIDQQVLVKEGKLANVMVRVIKGATGTFDPPAAPVVVIQEGCRYTPRVQGAMAGQSITVRSEDLTTHNVHAMVGEETLFNRAQQKGEFTKPASAFKQLNGAITFVCDIHPWMIGFVVVNSNPFFATTDEAGVATLSLPPGTYTLEAWHERFGTKTQTVTVEAGKPAAVQFQFSSEDHARP